ncbi:hypothetical protein [Persephonella sp.]
MEKEKGAVLLTTLMLGVIALIVIGALLAFVLYGERTSSPERRYTIGLEAAKGVADFVMKGLMDNTLICTDETNSCQCKCNELLENLNCPTCVGSTTLQNVIKIPVQYQSINNYNIEARILSKTDSTNSEIFGVQVTAINPDTDEKAIIEFVFKVNY